MSRFEVKATDLLGRVGRLHTRHGALETPALLPVVHPINQEIDLNTIKKIGFKAVMTNAYITLKRIGEEAAERGIHSIIGFDGIIMTDSGGYQVLEYGEVDVTPAKMTTFQEEIGSDIAVVLDRPTGFSRNRAFAEQTVKETLKAAKETIETKKKSDTLWVGPIQGGLFTDLVAESARSTSTLPFDLHALGSPTEVMKSYHYRHLVKMIIAAKANIPLSRPLHLFGAGHPLTMPLAVALGCDLFDSASYILYAKDDRYLTPTGTQRFDELAELTCPCPICTQHTVNEIKASEKAERIRLLATHNLYLLQSEVKQLKQAIVDGRLWEAVAQKARSHPRLWSAFEDLTKHSKLLEDGTPLFKKRAIYLYTKEDLRRPEVRRAMAKIRRNYQPKKKSTLIIFTLSSGERILAAPFCKRLLQQGVKDHQLLYLSPIYRLIPIELTEIYPISQTLHPISLNNLPTKTLHREAKRIIEEGGYKQIIAVCLNKHLHTKLTNLATKLKIKLLDYCKRGSKGQTEAAEETLRAIYASP
ncbi:MAG: tRNA guanosine(15) transglycosylase TgtA [Thaumarchaeota archaeon]|nr:tRNA guanosine(15) transglycosylase TgtA [Nitrososphaerota archaeon]